MIDIVLEPVESPVEAAALRAEAYVHQFAQSMAAGDLSPEEAERYAVAAQRVLAVAQAAAISAAGAAKSCKIGLDEGYRTTKSWLADKCHLPPARAGSALYCHRTLLRMPKVSEAFLFGQINQAHVDAFCKVWSPKVANDFARDEEFLLSSAQTLPYLTFLNALRYWEICADPDGTFNEAESARNNRQFRLSKVGDRAYGSIITDALTASEILGLVSEVERELFAADWAEARSRLGDRATANDLRRTASQRNHDAFVELCRRGAASAPDAVKPKPHTHIVMDKKTFETQAAAWARGDDPPAPDGTGDWFGKMRCETIDGKPVHPGAAIAHVMRGTINRAIFESPSCVLDFGRTQRLFTGPLRRAMILRDQECTEPGCHVPGDQCEVDHTLPWSRGARPPSATAG